MHIEGDVSLDTMVWLSQAPEASAARALAEALPEAEWSTQIGDRARVSFRGNLVEFETRMGVYWAGLITGRVHTNRPHGHSTDLKAEATPLPVAPLRIESCWFALDEDGRVACFDRDQLGAAPIKRCWGPRKAHAFVPANSDDLTGRHGSIELAARGFTFTADPSELARAFSSTRPRGASRRWMLSMSHTNVVLSTGLGTTTGEPVQAAFLNWLHEQKLCRGCCRSALSDARLNGVYVYQHEGRARAKPYDRVSEAITYWTANEAAEKLGLLLDNLKTTSLPLKFERKDRLQPIEYARCTWSDTVPWESEAGQKHVGKP